MTYGLNEMAPRKCEIERGYGYERLKAI